VIDRSPYPRSNLRLTAIGEQLYAWQVPCDDGTEEPVPSSGRRIAIRSWTCGACNLQTMRQVG
jgi:hypothetical protein